MVNEKKQLENIRILDFDYRSRRGAIRLAYTGGLKNLQRKRRATSPISPGDPVPHRLGHPICAYGLQRCADLYGAAIQGTKSRLKHIYRPACCKFLLESHILQCPGLWLCFFLAAFVVGIGIVDDSYFPQIRSTCRLSSDPLFDLADLCRLSEPGRMVFELTKRLALGIAQRKSFFYIISK